MIYAFLITLALLAIVLFVLIHGSRKQYTTQVFFERSNYGSYMVEVHINGAEYKTWWHYNRHGLYIKLLVEAFRSFTRFQMLLGLRSVVHRDNGKRSGPVRHLIIIENGNWTEIYQRHTRLGIFHRYEPAEFGHYYRPVHNDANQHLCDVCDFLRRECQATGTDYCVSQKWTLYPPQDQQHQSYYLQEIISNLAAPGTLDLGDGE